MLINNIFTLLYISKLVSTCRSKQAILYLTMYALKYVFEYGRVHWLTTTGSHLSFLTHSLVSLYLEMSPILHLILIMTTSFFFGSHEQEGYSINYASYLVYINMEVC